MYLEPTQTPRLPTDRRGSGRLIFVDTDRFRLATLEIMRTGKPSSGYDLLGMSTDVDVYLSMPDALDPDSVDVERTDRPDRLICASCRAATGASLGEAAAAVEHTWMEHLRYRYREAHVLTSADGVATLHFITQMGERQIYVTGQIEIRPSQP